MLLAGYSQTKFKILWDYQIIENKGFNQVRDQEI